MELSKEVIDLLNQAIGFAQKNNYEYVTPEIVLLMIMKDQTFAEAFEECGGNLSILEDDIREYIEECIEKIENIKPELTDGVNTLLNNAGRSAYSSGCKEIYLRHVIYGLWNLSESYAVW